MEVPKKLKTQLLNDLAIPLLGIYLKQMKTVTQKSICTTMFAASLPTSKIWKQPKYPLMDTSIEKLCNIYSGILFSHIEVGNVAICHSMCRLKGIMLSEVKSD